jgi:RNA polymerase sigma-70 factor (ECF subfamily)
MDRLDQLRQRVVVLKCQLGDRAAWEELYRRYNPSLGYYLRRLMGDGQSAADAQQETWLAVLRHIARLRSPEAFTVWFYRIARSNVMGLLEDSNVHVPLDEQTPQAIEDRDDAFSSDDADRVHAALSALSAQHREVLLLRFMEDLSYEQVAQVVGCGVGTVRSRIHYAKCALRRQLENDHE